MGLLPQGEFAGFGVNHAGEQFEGKLIIHRKYCDFDYLLTFEARLADQSNAERLHSEAIMVHISNDQSADSACYMSSQLAGIMRYDVITSTQADTFVLQLVATCKAEPSYTHKLIFAVTGDEIKYSTHWALATDPLTEKSSCTLIRKAS